MRLFCFCGFVNKFGMMLFARSINISGMISRLKNFLNQRIFSKYSCLVTLLYFAFDFFFLLHMMNPIVKAIINTKTTTTTMITIT